MLTTAKSRTSMIMKLPYEVNKREYLEVLKTYNKMVIGPNCTLQLNIAWSDEKLGFAINQIMSGEAIPLTKYYYWPQTDVWRHLQSDLEERPWITFKQRRDLLGPAIKIMSFWRNK